MRRWRTGLSHASGFRRLCNRCFRPVADLQSRCERLSMRVILILAVSAICGSCSTAISRADPSAILSSKACELRTSARYHVGEVITFRGRYSSDGRERARIDIEECSHRYGVQRFADGLEKVMDQDALIGFYPNRSVEALFTARIELVPPNTLSYQDDDGVRLALLSATDIEAVPE